jgi:hypothetical protein
LLLHATGRSVNRVKKMAEEGGSGRASASGGYKAELYESLELLLSDKDFRFLCRLQDGVYREVLLGMLKKVLRPTSFDDVNDFISGLTQIGALKIELDYVEVPVPKQLLIKKKKTKKGEVEVLQIPKGFELVGEVKSPTGEPLLLLRTYKQVLKPSEELIAVCRNLAASAVSLN